MINIFDIPKKLYNISSEDIPNTGFGILDKDIDGVVSSLLKTKISSIDTITYNNIKFTSVARVDYYIFYNKERLPYIEDLFYVNDLSDFKRKVDKFIFNIVFL